MITFAMLSLFQIEAMAFWAFGVKVNIATYSIVAMALVLCNALLKLKRKMSVFDINNLRLKKLDLLVLSPAIIISSLIWGRVILPSTYDSTSIVQSISFGVDNATHAMMYNDAIRSEGNPLIDKEGPKLSLPQFSSYPRGWHIATAVVSSSVYNFKGQPVKTVLTSYFYVKLFTLFSLIVSLCAFMLTLCQKIGARNKSLVEYVAFMTTAIGISVILFLPIYIEGFFSFLPVLSYLLLFSTFIIDDSKQEEGSSDLFIGLFIIASAFTWMLTAPMLLISIVIKRYSEYRLLRKIPATTWLTVLASLIACFIQAYILISADKNVIQAIAAEGGLTYPTHMLLFVCLSVFTIFYIYEKKYRALADSLMSIVLPVAFLLLALLAFITIKSQPISYYYFKLQFAVLTILLPIFCILLIKQLSSRFRLNFSSQIIGMSFVITLLGLSIPSIVGYEYFSSTLNRILAVGLNAKDSSSVVDQSLNRNFNSDNSRIIYFYPQSAARTTLLSHIARLSYISSSCDQSIFIAISKIDAEALGSYLQSSDCKMDSTNMTINTDSLGYTQLHSTIPKYILDKRNITFKVSAD